MNTDEKTKAHWRTLEVKTMVGREPVDLLFGIKSAGPIPASVKDDVEGTLARVWRMLHEVAKDGPGEES